MINEFTDTWGVSEDLTLKVLKKYAWQKEKALDHLAEELDSITAKSERYSSAKKVRM